MSQSGKSEVSNVEEPTTFSTKEFWVTRDYGGDGVALNLSRASLGRFVYHLLRLGGEITSTWAMGPQYDRSYVQMGIRLPAGRREELEKASGVNLEPPPKLALPVSREGGSFSKRSQGSQP